MESLHSPRGQMQLFLFRITKLLSKKVTGGASSGSVPYCWRCRWCGDDHFVCSFQLRSRRNFSGRKASVFFQNKPLEDFLSSQIVAYFNSASLETASSPSALNALVDCMQTVLSTWSVQEEKPDSVYPLRCRRYNTANCSVYLSEGWRKEKSMSSLGLITQIWIGIVECLYQI